MNEVNDVNEMNETPNRTKSSGFEKIQQTNSCVNDVNEVNETSTKSKPLMNLIAIFF